MIEYNAMPTYLIRSLIEFIGLVSVGTVQSKSNRKDDNEKREKKRMPVQLMNDIVVVAVSSVEE